jgi:hypothetical protein
LRKRLSHWQIARIQKSTAVAFGRHDRQSARPHGAIGAC